MSKQHKAPPYSEEQTTEWLAWLAYNMQCNDQIVFQIENLQPNCLAGEQETKLYLLLTRTLWGVFIGLILGSSGTAIFWPSADLSESLGIGLILGLFF
ncbi:MAG: hypothetical protein KDE19_02710 [Caldilineaceae bacterium]|nr:hypothetical protein [Caldilineaceae bacterium]